MKKMDKSTSKLIIGTVVFFAFMLTITLRVMPYINHLSDPVTQQRIKDWINSLGTGGWLLVLGVQVAQVVIAFIPGEPVEILSGILYGGVGGLLLCLLGCVIASSGIFFLSQKFGTPLVEKLFNKRKFDNFAFLKDSRKLEAIVFILFLIPGTPKDMLTYIVGTSPMKITQFLLISTFARIPSIISSTYIGYTMRQGEWGITILIFALTAAFGVLGIKYQDSIIGFCKEIGIRIKSRMHGEKDL